MPTNPFSDLGNVYTWQHSAEALFFRSTIHQNVKALRVLVPDLKLEFSDNNYIGTDPSGVFFYNGNYDGDTSKVLTAVKYKSSTVTDPRNNQTLASVKFSNSRNEVIAEFLGADRFHTVRAADMDPHEGSGEWKALSISSFANAKVSKSANDNKLTLEADQVNGKVVVTMDLGHVVEEEKLKRDLSKANELNTLQGRIAALKAVPLTNAEGKLHYGGNKTALLGSYANYSNDRIVFYDNDNVGNIVRAYVRYISSIFANVH
ncbi:hypothetical protein AX14_006233 [Amanita brunnescens Koide BX004]|nr:hypothetical protein AX14_006233 [Amanita brunnescens Koide BX004]